MTEKMSSDLLAFAREVGSSDPVAAEGRRTRWDLGGALDEGTKLVSAPVGIYEIRPEEMTVRAGAGTDVSTLHASLQEVGQTTCLPDRGGTIGGALAVGQNELRCLGRGLVRDAVLQVRYISADGKVITAGGPTVKNVTGYDIPKLMVGSLGTLGLIGEVTLRTNPIPAHSVWYAGPSEDPTTVFTQLVNPSAALWDGRTVWVLLEGHMEDIEQEIRRVETSAMARVSGPPALPPFRSSTSLDVLPKAVTKGEAVLSLGTGIVYSREGLPERPLDSVVSQLQDAIKIQFDPTHRLNPGRAA